MVVGERTLDPQPESEGGKGQGGARRLPRPWKDMLIGVTLRIEKGLSMEWKSRQRRLPRLVKMVQWLFTGPMRSPR